MLNGRTTPESCGSGGEFEAGAVEKGLERGFAVAVSKPMPGDVVLVPEMPRRYRRKGQKPERMDGDRPLNGNFFKELHMNKGIIFYFRPKQQFGFVRDDSGAEWFFHTSNSPDFTPILGARVQFELAPPIRLGKRDQAINLRPVEVVEEGNGGGK